MVIFKIVDLNENFWNVIESKEVKCCQVSQKSAFTFQVLKSNNADCFDERRYWQ